MFEIGNDVFMEMDKKRTKTRLVAWKVRDGKGYLLVEPPLVSGEFPPLRTGHGVVIRLENGGRIFNIPTVYIEPLKKTGLLMFSLLEGMEVKPLRSEDRIRCVMPIALAGDMAGNGTIKPVGEGMVFDVSLGGLGFCSENALDLPPSGEVFLTFQPGGMGQVKNLKMKIIRINPIAHMYEYSGKFNITPDDQGDKDNVNILSAYLKFCNQWGETSAAQVVRL